MTTTYLELIAAFPEFGNAAVYPQSQVDFWLGQAPEFINQCRLRPAQLPLATMLWTAHNLVLSRRDKANAAVPGGTPGEAVGPTTAKSVDKVSISFGDQTSSEGAGSWNATSYGQRFWQLIKGVNTAMYVPGPRRRFGVGSLYRGGFR